MSILIPFYKLNVREQQTAVPAFTPEHLERRQRTGKDETVEILWLLSQGPSINDEH